MLTLEMYDGSQWRWDLDVVVPLKIRWELTRPTIEMRDES
jgi:hypothetical protein